MAIPVQDGNNQLLTWGANAGIQPPQVIYSTVLTAVISVDDIKIYKPAPRVYQLAPARLEVDKDEIGFLTSNYWDAAGTRNFGFRVFWINRAGSPPYRPGIDPDVVLDTLAARIKPGMTKCRAS